MNSLIHKYYKYKTKAEKYANNRSARDEYVRLSNKASRIKYELFSLWIPELEESDSEFKELALRNRELLKDIQFRAVTKTTGVSLFNQYINTLNGRIRPNGLLIAKAESSGGLFEFLDGVYYRSYRGQIDCLGHFNIEGSRQSYSFFKSLPKSFNVRTYGEDTILFETKDRETELFKSGKEIIKEIMGRPFQDPKVELEFLNNRGRMYEILQDKLNSSI